MINRKNSRTVYVGGVPIGGDNPIAIQSMTNTDTESVQATLSQIHVLEEAGCELVRVAVPTEKSALNLGDIKKEMKVPLIADIHFDYRLAIKALDNGADKVRINPGNIGDFDRVDRVIEKAGELGKAIRIGVNSGSLEKKLLEKHGGPSAEALVESAESWVEYFEKKKFNNIIISVKSSHALENYEANRLLSASVDYPLHIGVTEAGGWEDGLIKSAAGIGSLLIQGVGDTVRVSLTGDPAQEVYAARKLLQFLDIRKFSPEIISCPTCGRCKIDLESLARQARERLKKVKSPITVAIMGCVVNGPGEAKEADCGIAGGKDEGILFKKGKVVKKVPAHELIDELMKLIKEGDFKCC